MVGYDPQSTKVRARLANSPFNICPVCLENDFNCRTDAEWFKAIAMVEQKIRRA
jgi:hypothetical protein